MGHYYLQDVILAISIYYQIGFTYINVLPSNTYCAYSMQKRGGKHIVACEIIGLIFKGEK